MRFTFSQEREGAPQAAVDCLCWYDQLSSNLIIARSDPSPNLRHTSSFDSSVWKALLNMLAEQTAEALSAEDAATGRIGEGAW